MEKLTDFISDKFQDLLPIHALSGCDSMSYPFEKGNISDINLLLKSDISLDLMCEIDAPWEIVTTTGTNFLIRLYVGQAGSDISEL